jgi:hypothetical protein
MNPMRLGVIAILGLFGWLAPARSQVQSTTRDLCFLMPKDLPLTDRFNQIGELGDLVGRGPSARVCGVCGRGLPSSRPQEVSPLIIRVNHFSNKEAAHWHVHRGKAWRKPNATFGDGPAYIGTGVYSFPRGNYTIEVLGAGPYAARVPAIAQSLDQAVQAQPNECPGNSGQPGAGCDVQSIQPAELTGPNRRELDSELVRFTWGPGKLIRDYQLTVDTAPGGAMLGNIGPGKATSASIRMPARESPIYVTLFSFPQCGNGPALSKSYTFQYPGPPGIK